MKLVHSFLSRRSSPTSLLLALVKQRHLLIIIMSSPYLLVSPFLHHHLFLPYHTPSPHNYVIHLHEFGSSSPSNLASVPPSQERVPNLAQPRHLPAPLRRQPTSPCLVRGETKQNLKVYKLASIATILQHHQSATPTRSSLRISLVPIFPSGFITLRLEFEPLGFRFGT